MGWVAHVEGRSRCLRAGGGSQGEVDASQGGSGPNRPARTATNEPVWQRSAPQPPISVNTANRALRCAAPAPAAGSHDNVVALRGLCKHGSHYYLVMELCPR